MKDIEFENQNVLYQILRDVVGIRRKWIKNVPVLQWISYLSNNKQVSLTHENVDEFIYTTKWRQIQFFLFHPNTMSCQNSSAQSDKRRK